MQALQAVLPMLCYLAKQWVYISRCRADLRGTCVLEKGPVL